MAKVDIEQLAFDYNNAVAKEKLTKNKNVIDQVLIKYNYKNRATLTTILHNAGYRKRSGRFIKCAETIKERNKSIKMETREKDDDTKLITCNFPGCGKKFKTKVDNLGIPYKKRCVKCSGRLKTNPINEPLISYGKKVGGQSGDY